MITDKRFKFYRDYIIFTDDKYEFYLEEEKQIILF